MQWSDKMSYMSRNQPGIPQSGSTGNVAYAPGMMDVFSRGNGTTSVPSARQMRHPQINMDSSNWQSRSSQMSMGASPTNRAMNQSRNRPTSIGPQISNDIAARIMQAIDIDSSRQRY